MYTAIATLKGMVPLKENKVPASYAEDVGTGGGVRIKKPILEECAEKVYEDKKGFFLPAHMLNAVIIAGLSAPKPLISNRVKLHKKTVKACIFVNTDGYLTYGKDPVEWVPNTTFVPTLNGLAVQNRPMFKEGWETTFEISCVQDWLTPEVLKEGIIRAGLCHGLGSHKPLFGRFILKDFKIKTQ